MTITAITAFGLRLFANIIVKNINKMFAKVNFDFGLDLENTITDHR